MTVIIYEYRSNTNTSFIFLCGKKYKLVVIKEENIKREGYFRILHPC